MLYFVFERLAVASEVKRKVVSEQQDESAMASAGFAKAQRLEYGQESSAMLDEGDNDSDRRCVDLIVLGISYRSLEEEVKKCFEAFGELVFCEVRCRMKLCEQLRKILH